MVVYQFSNSIQITFIILFVVLAIISVIISVYCFPLLKLFFQNENSIKSRTILLCVCIIIYFLCIALFVLSVKNIISYCNNIKNTDIEKCNVVVGDIIELKKIPQYARGADLVSYHMIFKIENTQFHIDTDNGVTLENIKKWDNIERAVVYYHTIKDKNVVIRVENTEEDNGTVSVKR